MLAICPQNTAERTGAKQIQTADKNVKSRLTHTPSDFINVNRLLRYVSLKRKLY